MTGNAVTLSGLVLLCAGAQLSGCSPSIDIPGQTSPRAEPSVSALQMMSQWLHGFQNEQEREFAERSRYCSEVTCDGKVSPLPPPYETDYTVSASGKGYQVRVFHPPSGGVCELEDGFDAYPDWAGRVRCRSTR